MARKPMSGWCANELHGRCPGLIREARTTPKGKDLSQMVCPCRCHKEPRSAAS